MMMSGTHTQKMPMKSQGKVIVDHFHRAGTNTPSLVLRYILPTGWEDIDGKLILSAFQSLRLCIMVLCVGIT